MFKISRLRGFAIKWGCLQYGSRRPLVVSAAFDIAAVVLALANVIAAVVVVSCRRLVGSCCPCSSASISVRNITTKLSRRRNRRNKPATQKARLRAVSPRNDQV